MYGKQTETAIAAMSRLAEVYDEGRTRLSATEIATDRGLQRPFVGKILSTLSQAGLVDGSPGPGGGYMLARTPGDITIFDVYRLFEREDSSVECPFGGGICGVGEACALHDRLVDLKETLDRMLHETTFEDFRRRYQDEGLRPAEVIPVVAGTTNGHAPPNGTADSNGHAEPADRHSYRASRRARGGATR
ncbi:MAG: Rrf2 family transcriptional regulator [Phycisphaerales bacterium]